MYMYVYLLALCTVVMYIALCTLLMVALSTVSTVSDVAMGTVVTLTICRPHTHNNGLSHSMYITTGPFT